MVKVHELLLYKKVSSWELMNDLQFEKFYIYEKNFYDNQNLLSSWVQFRESNCKNEIIFLFENKEFILAFELFKLCENRVTVTDTLEIFREIPAYFDVIKVKIWIMNQVIPKLGKQDLESFEEILVSKAIELDKNGIAPKVIITFLETLDEAFYFKKISKSRLEDFAKVKKLKSEMLRLIRMMNTYSFRLTYEELIEIKNEALGQRILETVTPDNLSQKVNNLLKPYCEEKGLNHEFLIFSFIKEKSESETRIIEKSFKEILFSLIKEIKDPELRSLSIKTILDCKYLESPALFETLINYGLTYENSLKYFFLKLKLSDHFKKISQKYTSDIIDVAKESDLMRFLIFILNSKSLTCIEDALEIAEMVEGLTQEEVFIHFVESVIEKKDLERLDRLKNAIVKVSSPEEVFDGIISFLLNFLSDDYVKVTSSERKKFVFVCKITEKIIKDLKISDRYAEDLEIVKKLIQLAEKFNIFLTYREYFEFKCRKQKMKESINIYIEFQLIQIESLNTEIFDYSTFDIPSTTQEAIFRIGSLLSIDFIDLSLKLAKEYSFNDILYNRTINFLKDISKYNLTMIQTNKLIKISSNILFKAQEVMLVTDIRQVFEVMHYNNLGRDPIQDSIHLKAIQKLQNLESFLISQVKKPKSIEDWFPEDLQITPKSLLDLKDDYISSDFLSDGSDVIRIAKDLSIANGSRTPMFLLESAYEKTTEINFDSADELIERQFWNILSSEKIDDFLFLQIILDLRDSQVLDKLISDIQKGKSSANLVQICKLAKIFYRMSGFSEKEQEWEKVEDFAKINQKLKEFKIDLAGLAEEADELEKIYVVFEKGACINFAFELADYLKWNPENVICGYIKNLVAVPKLINITVEDAIANYPMTYPFKTDYTTEIEYWIQKLSHPTAEKLIKSCLELICDIDYERVLFLVNLMQNYGKSLSHISAICEYLKTYKRKLKASENEHFQIDSNPNLSKEIKKIFNTLLETHIGISSFLKNSLKEVKLSDCSDFAKLSVGLQKKADDIFYFAVINEVETQMETQGLPPDFHELCFALYKISGADLLIQLLDEISYHYMKTEDIFALRKHQLNKIKNSLNPDEFDLQYYEKQASEDKVVFLLHRCGLFDFYPSIKNGHKLVTDIYENCLPKLAKNPKAFEKELLKELIHESFKFHSINSEDFHYDLALEWLSSETTQTSLSISSEAHSHSAMLSQIHPGIPKLVELIHLYPESSLILNLEAIVSSNSNHSNLVKARILSVFQSLNIDFSQIFNTSLDQATLVRFFYYWADLQSLKQSIRLEDLLIEGTIEKCCAKLIYNQATDKKSLQFLTAFVVQEELKDALMYKQVLELLLKVKDYESLIIYLKFMISSKKMQRVAVFVELKQTEIFVEAAKVLLEPWILRCFVECARIKLKEKTLFDVLRIFALSSSENVCKAAFLLAQILGEYFKTYLICLLLPNHFHRIIKFSNLIKMNLELSSKESFIKKADRNLKYFNKMKSLVSSNS